MPQASGEAPVRVEIDAHEWWLNRDQRGGVWINAGEAKKAETGTAPEGPAGEPAPAQAQVPPEIGAPPVPATGPQADAATVLAAVRLLLKRTRTGASAGQVGKLAATLGKTPEELVGALVAAGLKAPGKPRERPVFVEHAGEIFWLNRNVKDELWLNAKASKFGAARGGEEAPKEESRSAPAEEQPPPAAPPEGGATTAEGAQSG